MPRASGCSRRSARALAVAVGLALAATACPRAGRPGPAAPPGSAATGSPAAGGGGAITVAYPNEPATLDPFAAGGDLPATRDLVRLVMPAFERLGPAGERTPWLLASPPSLVADDPTRVSIVIRDDAVWSDGRAITMDDVRFTWRHARATRARDGYDRIAAVEAESPKRGVIVFRGRFGRWRDLFSAGLGVLPAHSVRSARARARLARAWPVSGGPFVLRRWRRGLDITFERNTRAWGSGTVPDRVRVVFVPDAVGALELLARGSVDVLGPYQAAEWTRRARERGAEVSTDRGGTWTGILLNASTGVLRDRTVRQAFAHSLDRERLVRALVREEGDVLHSVGPAPDPADGPFDAYGSLRRARAMLARAGWRGDDVRRRRGARLSFTLATTAADALPSGYLMRAMQQQAGRAGFAVDSVRLDVEDLVAWVQGPRFRAAVLTWRDPPGGAVRSRFVARRLARARDRTLERALTRADDVGADAAGGTPTPSASATPAPEPPQADPAQERLAELVWVLPLYSNAVTLAARGVDGVRSSAAADGPFWNAHEWRRAA